jgi:transcriptional regulator with XRE-family HTH domain
LRDAGGLTQEDLAEAVVAANLLNWSQTTVAEVELGQRHVHLDEALALAAFFGVTLERLLEAQGGPIPLGHFDRTSPSGVRALLGLAGDASDVLPADRRAAAFAPGGSGSPVTPRLARELEDFAERGGDPKRLIELRRLVAEGAISQKQYAALKLGELRRLKAARARGGGR